MADINTGTVDNAFVPVGGVKVNGTTVINTTGQVTGSLSTAGLTSTTTNSIVPVIIGTVQQALSGAGAVNITSHYTAVTSTGANALTLAASTIKGQLKKVQLIVDGGDATLTFNTNATIVFADAGDFAVLLWNGTAWVPVELGNDADGATAPVYTPAS